MKYKKITISLFMITILLIMQFSVICLPANAKPTKPTLKNDPMNGQILPFYEVWLRWNDVSNEAYYSMTVRDLGMGGNLGDSGPLIYNKQQVAQNSTYFIIPTSKLTRGHHYRWCLRAHDSSGAATLADAHIFAIESSSVDSHLLVYTESGNTYTMEYPTNRLEYFIYATTSGYDSVLNQAVQAWNGIANVSLVRTATPTDNHYEVRVYESPTPADRDLFGRTVTSSRSIENGKFIVDYSEVRTFIENIKYRYENPIYDFVFINTHEQYRKPNGMHEIGHALLLGHSVDGEDINYTTSSTGSNPVPLIMNTLGLLGSELNVVDRDHLRMKWGT